MGDGDCGSTIAKGASSVLESLDKLPADDLPATVQALAHLGEREGGLLLCRLLRVLCPCAGCSMCAAPVQAAVVQAAVVQAAGASCVV